MPSQLAEKIVRNACARVVKSQPGSGVHVPAPVGDDWLTVRKEDMDACRAPPPAKVRKTDMAPPINNLEATMIDAAFHEPAAPQARVPIAVATAEARHGTTPGDQQEQPVGKAALTAEGRKHVAEDNFALSGRRYPIHDMAHAKNALARSSGKPEEAQVKAAVYRRYPSLKVEKSAEAEPRRVSTVAVRHGDNLLMGKRRDTGKWTTPGGHAEPGEDHHQAAHRELEEEAGLKVDPQDMHALTDVHKLTDQEGKPLHVQPFQVELTDKPATSMKGDPDGEVHRWRWVDVSKGLPDEIAQNMHTPLERNVLMKACGLGAPEPAVKDGADGDDDEADGSALPPDLADYQAITSGIDYEMAAGGVGVDEAMTAAVANLGSDPDYYADRWADVNGVDSADLLSKSADAGPNGLSLDLASGQARRPGYVGMDLYPFDHGTMIQDLNLGIPVPDGCVAKMRLVNAPDVLKEASDVLLPEISRVMKPGGRFMYEGPQRIDKLEGFDEEEYEDDDPDADVQGVVKDGGAADPAEGVEPIFRQVFTRRANPDPAAANDAYPRLGLAQSDMLPADAALALDALGDFWSDNITSGRGNRLYGYPSQGALVEKKFKIAKISPEKQIVYCVVLSPDELDEDDDIMSAEDIEKAAHNYLINSRVIGDTHDKTAAAAPVESYICPADCEWSIGPYGPQVVKKGAWVIGIKVFDPALWQKVKKGEYQSVSVGGAGLRDPIN